MTIKPLEIDLVFVLSMAMGVLVGCSLQLLHKSDALAWNGFMGVAIGTMVYNHASYYIDRRLYLMLLDTATRQALNPSMHCNLPEVVEEHQLTLTEKFLVILIIVTLLWVVAHHDVIP